MKKSKLLNFATNETVALLLFLFMKNIHRLCRSDSDVTVPGATPNAVALRQSALIMPSTVLRLAVAIGAQRFMRPTQAIRGNRDVYMNAYNSKSLSRLISTPSYQLLRMHYTDNRLLVTDGQT